MEKTKSFKTKRGVREFVEHNRILDFQILVLKDLLDKEYYVVKYKDCLNQPCEFCKQPTTKFIKWRGIPKMFLCGECERTKKYKYELKG